MDRQTLTCDELGPQLLNEAMLSRRLRFHQSWYRYAVLHEADWGSTMAPKCRELGSILTKKASEKRLNFLSEEASTLYDLRRRAGWGIDPVRCLQYLISSQAMMINICGPLLDDPIWLIAVLNRVLGRSDIQSIEFAEIEYAPHRRSAYLGDMTHLDALIIVRTDFDTEVVVLEFKYADRFNSRMVDIAANPNYWELAKTSELWVDPSHVFNDRRSNQLLRCHALGAKIAEIEVGKGVRTNLVVVHHDNDQQARKTVEHYKQSIVDPHDASAATIKFVLELMACHARSDAQREIALALMLRYGNEIASENTWIALARPVNASL